VFSDASFLFAYHKNCVIISNMRVAVTMWQCVCEKCAKGWLSRSSVVPAQCPNCKSTKWDKTGAVKNIVQSQVEKVIDNFREQEKTEYTPYPEPEKYK